jgi:hypothetical protein
MIEAVRDERGLSFCSSTTLAHRTGLHATTVRASRRRLVRHHYFEEVRKGGQNRSTVLTPNRRLVEAVHAVGLNSWMPVPQVFSAPKADKDDHALQVTDLKEGSVPFVASTTTGILTSGRGGSLPSFLAWTTRLPSGDGSESSAFGFSFPSEPWPKRSAFGSPTSQMWNVVVID